MKLTRFLIKHEMAPLCIKLKVKNACVNSFLLNSCEEWGNTSIKALDLLHRNALKLILGVSKSTPN